jgi:hypothetical protein
MARLLSPGTPPGFLPGSACFSERSTLFHLVPGCWASQGWAGPPAGTQVKTVRFVYRTGATSSSPLDSGVKQLTVELELPQQDQILNSQTQEWGQE